MDVCRAFIGGSGCVIRPLFAILVLTICMIVPFSWAHTRHPSFRTSKSYLALPPMFVLNAQDGFLNTFYYSPLLFQHRHRCLSSNQWFCLDDTQVWLVQTLNLPRHMVVFSMLLSPSLAVNLSPFCSIGHCTMLLIL